MTNAVRLLLKFISVVSLILFSSCTQQMRDWVTSSIEIAEIEPALSPSPALPPPPAPAAVVVLSPAKDGLKVSNLTKSSVPVSGTCSKLGDPIIISGDASASPTCQLNGTWSANLDFSSASDGTLSVEIIQYNGISASISTFRSFNKSSAICDDPVKMAGVPFAAGSGTTLDPYILCSVAQLEQVGAFANKEFRMENDIDMGAVVWSTISGFSGVFDGNGFVIKNLNYSTSSGYTGFMTDLWGTVKNLGLVDINFTGYCHMGGIAGTTNSGSLIHNSYVTGHMAQFNMSANNDAVGGLVGQHAGTITNSFTQVLL